MQLADKTNNKIKNKRTCLSTYKKLQVFTKCHGLCNICSTKLNKRYHVDHIRPLHLGGTNDLNNLQVLCLNCHDAKTLKEMIHFNTNRFGKCQFCFKKLIDTNDGNSNSKKDHRCDTNDIYEYESRLEFRTGESKYFIQGTYSYHNIN